MSKLTTADAIEVFSRASNLNSSIKNFLKKEVRKGDELERFTKNFKSAVGSGDEARAQGFLDKYLESHAKWLLALAGYAHIDFVGAVSEKVVTQFAEDFNKTYNLDDGTLKVTDKKNFERIAKESLGIINAELKTYELENSEFMRRAVMNAIFDDRVLEQVIQYA